MIGHRLIRSVHDYDNDAAVFVHEPRTLETHPVCRYRDTMRAGPDEFGEMPDIIKSIGIDQLAVAGIAMHRRKTEIPGMVGSAVLIQQDVPVGPARGAVVEIVDHAIPIPLAQRPGLQTVNGKLLLTTFGKKQRLSRKGAAFHRRL